MDRKKRHIYKDLKSLLKKNFHERIILFILYFEKGACMKWPFKVLRKIILQMCYHCEIHPDSFINKEAIVSCRLPHPYMIIIHRKTILGRNLVIFQGVTIGVIEKGQQIEAPVLGDDVYVGAKASILGNVEIGKGAKIGAHTLVLDDVAPGETAIGLHKQTKIQKK